MSQTRLAELSGIGRDTINRLEHGKQEAYPSTIEALAGVLGVQPADLLTTPPGEHKAAAPRSEERRHFRALGN